MVLLFTRMIVDAFLLSLTLSTGFAIGITVTTQLALFPDAVAVMVVVPTANAVTTPSETVATDSSEVSFKNDDANLKVLVVIIHCHLPIATIAVRTFP